jgi:hypothetical protein
VGHTDDNFEAWLTLWALGSVRHVDPRASGRRGWQSRSHPIGAFLVFNILTCTPRTCARGVGGSWPGRQLRLKLEHLGRRAFFRSCRTSPKFLGVCSYYAADYLARIQPTSPGLLASGGDTYVRASHRWCSDSGINVTPGYTLTWGILRYGD